MIHISLIINQSLFTGIFPDSLKIAKILPIFKKGDPSYFGNYRPISLLPAVSKVFEKVVFIQIYEYFNSNNLLYKSQYGFRANHSTELAGIEFVDKILHYLDDQHTPISIFLDLSKAFDTLDHDILLFKLKYYGITGTPYKWFCSYLSNRQQYTQYGAYMSERLKITTGVPQGSILGPLLFIIYMNDIYTVSDSFQAILYADDTTLTTAVGSLTRMVAGLQEISRDISFELSNIYLWLTANRLSLNFDKTKYMIFHTSGCKMDDISLDIRIENNSIEQIREFNFLGLTINETMTWSSHVGKIASKIGRTVGVLHKLKHFLPKDVLKTIYNSLISPHLHFGVLSWGFKSSRIHKLQKKAVRAITSSKFNAHTEPLFKRLNILKISDIFDKQCLKFYHKFCNDMLPVFFNSMYVKQRHIHQYDTRQRDEIRNSATRLIMTEKCVRHYIPELLCKTPNCITDKFDSHSLQGFSLYVKKCLLTKYANECTIRDCYVCNNWYHYCIPLYWPLELCLYKMMHILFNLLLIYWCMSI